MDRKGHKMLLLLASSNKQASRVASFRLTRVSLVCRAWLLLLLLLVLGEPSHSIMSGEGSVAAAVAGPPVGWRKQAARALSDCLGHLIDSRLCLELGTPNCRHTFGRENPRRSLFLRRRRRRRQKQAPLPAEPAGEK